MEKNGLAITRCLCLSAISLGLLLLAFPSADWHVLAWVGLVPLFLLMKEAKLLHSVVFFTITGILFFCTLTLWATDLEKTWNFLLQGAALGVYWGLFAFICHPLERRMPRLSILIFPVTWVLIEYTRSNMGFLSWTFGILGYTQHSNLPVARIASFAGVYGVTFLILLVNVVISEVLLMRWKQGQQRIHKTEMVHVAAAGVLIAIMLGAGFSVKGMHPDLDKVSANNVAVVQGNRFWEDGVFETYAQYARDKFDTYSRLTMESWGSGESGESAPLLIVWPETAVPGKIPYNRRLVERLGDVAKDRRAHLLVGSAGYEKFAAQREDSDRAANSAFLFSPNGEITGRYDKIRLVPFNEYLPLRGLFKWPAWMIDAQMVDSLPGEELTVFKAGSLRFGVQICWENLFPDLFRQVAAQGVDFMVSMTNDNFTDSPAARYQMLNMNVFRAIENGVPIVRSTTSGVSAIILPDGRISKRLTDDNGTEVNVEGYLTAPLPVSSGRTFYNKHGDWFIVLLSMIFVLLVLAAVFTEIKDRMNSKKL